MCLAIQVLNVEQYCVRVRQNPREIFPSGVPARFKRRVNPVLTASTEEIRNE
jgi:hypothetical protein